MISFLASFLVYLFALLGFLVFLLGLAVFYEEKKSFLKKAKAENPKKVWFWKGAYISQDGYVVKYRINTHEIFTAIILEPKTIKKTFKKYPLFVKIGEFEFQRKEIKSGKDSFLKYEIL